MKGIVFDLFHTLVDPEDFRPKEFRRAEVVAETLGLDMDEFLAYWEGTSKERMITARQEIEYVEDFAKRKGIAPQKRDLVEAEAALGRYQDRALLRPREEVTRVLGELNVPGVRLGLLSNTYERDVREWPHSPLAPFFHSAAFSHEIGVAKPDLGAYRVILGLIGIEPNECAFIGDGGGQELTGARQAGFQKVVFMAMFVRKNGLRSEDQLRGFSAEADATAYSFQELSKMF